MHQPISSNNWEWNPQLFEGKLYVYFKIYLLPTHHVFCELSQFTLDMSKIVTFTNETKYNKITKLIKKFPFPKFYNPKTKILLHYFCLSTVLKRYFLFSPPPMFKNQAASLKPSLLIQKPPLLKFQHFLALNFFVCHSRLQSISKMISPHQHWMKGSKLISRLLLKTLDNQT